MIVTARVVSKNAKHTHVNVFIKSGPEMTAQLICRVVFNTETMKEEAQAFFNPSIVIEGQ